MAKSELSVQHMAATGNPVLNIRGTSYWRDSWWLLDVETSGLDRREDDIIALRLACMGDYKITQEREILVRPRRSIRPWAEKLTGITNQDLEQAIFLEEAVSQLEQLNGPFLFLDRDFTMPFLQNAWLRCGRKFALPCLLLDRLAARLLGCSSRQKEDRFLEQLPSSEVLGGTPPQDRCLKKLYELSLAGFHALEETYHIQNTAQLADFYEREAMEPSLM